MLLDMGLTQPSDDEAARFDGVAIDALQSVRNDSSVP